jgi:hypothetical protein
VQKPDQAGGAIVCTYVATKWPGPCSSLMQSHSDHSVAISPARRGGRPFDDWLERQLHEMYDAIAQEPLPGDLALLVEDRGDTATGTARRLKR